MNGNSFVDALERALPILERVARICANDAFAFPALFGHEREAIDRMIAVSRNASVPAGTRESMLNELLDVVEHIDGLLETIQEIGSDEPLNSSEEDLNAILELRATHELAKPYNGEHAEVIATTRAVKVLLTGKEKSSSHPVRKARSYLDDRNGFTRPGPGDGKPFGDDMPDEA